MIKFEPNEFFSPEKTFLCGQCFRWEKDENGDFFGVVENNAAKIHLGEDGVVFLESSNEDVDFWNNYFDFSRDYKKAEEFLNLDEKMQEPSKAGRGIRILRQDLWETTISFIISANNNIPRIKKIIESFCRLFGEKIEFNEKVFYGFPTPERVAKLSLSDLAPIKAGFRDKYILGAALAVANGEIAFSQIPDLSDEDAGEELLKIKGVGRKVADCILLFSLGRHSVFPLDVWTKRIINDLYGIEEKNSAKFVFEKFKNYSGIAQQYLYYYYAIQKK